MATMYRLDDGFVHMGPKGSFLEATGRSLAMTLVSELGDETFIIAALMAMRHPKGQVLGGALAALYLMTILSASFGWLVPKLLSPALTHKIATVMFFFFSARLAYIGVHADDSTVEEEVAEVEKQLRKSLRRSKRDSAKHESSKRSSKRHSSRLSDEEADAEPEPMDSPGDGEQDGGDPDSDEAPVARRLSSSSARKSKRRSTGRRSSKSSAPEGLFWGIALPAEVDDMVKQVKLPRDATELRRVLEALLTPVLIETFFLTFLAEWGDRSQVATITLAANNNPFGVCLGGFLGHGVCSTLAVFGGALMATQISQRTLAFIGSAIFLAFGLFNLRS